VRVHVADQAPSNWSVRSIDSLCTRVTSGGTPSRRISDYYGGDIPWIKTKELEDGWINGTEEAISESGLANSSAKVLPPNTVLMAMYGATVGKLALLSRPMACNQAACALIVDTQRADYRYIFYQLLNARTQIADLANGAAQQNLSAGTIKALLIPVPPIDEQRGIAATLGALDDKIESNRRQIALLEDLGAAMVEQRIKLDAYGFPGYDETRRLGDVLRVLETGSRPKGGVTASASGVVSLGGENIQSAGTCAARSFKRVSEQFAAEMKRGHLKNEDVLVYKDGGKPGNFTPHVSAFGHGFPAEAATINEHVYRIRSDGTISQALLYWLLRAPWMDQEMRIRGTGVAIPGLNSSNFRDLPLPILADDDVVILDDRLTPMFTAMLRLGTETRRLGALRDTLLPELLSGRLRVPEVRETVEEVIA